MKDVELFNDHYQNWKRYLNCKAQLIIADPPYNLGNNAYASNPAWYVDGDNKNGENELAGKEFFDTDKNFKPAEFMHFCSQMLVKEPKQGLTEEELESGEYGNIKDEKVGVSVKEIIEKGHYRYANKHFDSFGEAISYYSNNRNYKILEQDKEKLLVGDVFSGEIYEVKYYTYEEYADGKYYPDYTEETINEFRKGVEILKKARIYAQRIDWLLSGDDGEESFHERLNEELEQLKHNSDE